MANFAAVMRKIFCLMTALAAILAAIFAAGCGSGSPDGLRSGDLLFVYIPGDYDLYADAADDSDVARRGEVSGADVNDAARRVEAAGVDNISAAAEASSARGQDCSSDKAAGTDDGDGVRRGEASGVDDCNDSRRVEAARACTYSDSNSVQTGDAPASSAAAKPEPLNIHVAILEVSGDSTYVVDATIKRGVARYPLQDFLKDFTLKDGSLPQLEVFRPKVSADRARQFVNNALLYAGMPYDVDFLMDNSAMYCSELVYDAYITDAGEHLFSIGTIDFLSADGTVPLYWRQIFGLLQRDIPQGHPGVMPCDLTSSLLLERVGFSVASLESPL